MGTIGRLLRTPKIFATVFYRMLFTKKVISYQDRQVFWNVFLYLFALGGAGFLLVGKILVGVILALCSFLFSLKAIKYEYHKKKQTELIAAICNKDINYVTYILTQGADPNQADGLGNSPLKMAEKHGGSKTGELCEILKQYGAKDG